MDLADYFIKKLGHEKTAESVRNAIYSVNEVFSQIIPPETDEQKCIDFFFEKKDKCLIPQQNYYDLMDFWSIIEPYIWKWTRCDAKNTWLMEVIEEVELIRQVNQYNQILDTETKEHRTRLNALAFSIEDICNKKYATELEINQSGIHVKAIYPLRRFDEQCYHPYRDFIMQKLYQLLCSGGTIAVVAGSIGITPRRVYGYQMKDFKWEKWAVRSKKVRDAVFEENLEVRRNSIMPGYILDDVW